LKDRKVFVVDDLRYTIEYLRQRMHATALKKGVSHPNVLMVSKILDGAIYKFYRLELIQRAKWENNTW